MSSAHVLGLALENKYGAHLCVGPAIEDGALALCSSLVSFYLLAHLTVIHV